MKIVPIPKSIRRELVKDGGIHLFNDVDCKYYRWNGTKTHIDRGQFWYWPEKEDWDFIGSI